MNKKSHAEQVAEDVECVRDLIRFCKKILGERDAVKAVETATRIASTGDVISADVLTTVQDVVEYGRVYTLTRFESGKEALHFSLVLDVMKDANAHEQQIEDASVLLRNAMHESDNG